MKSLILDLEEELTNDQIDAIIAKLQARKQTKQKSGIVLTKKEKEFIKKLEKMNGESFNPNNWFEDEKFNADNYEQYIKTEFNYLLEDLQNNDIESKEDDIKHYKEEIKECQAWISKAKKEIPKIKAGFKILEQLMKSLKTRNI